MERAKVVNGTLELPNSVVRWIGRENELVVSVLGDTIVLKKIQPRPLSGFVKRDVKDAPMPMQEIVAEVKKARRMKKRARRS